MIIYKEFSFDSAHFLPNVPEGHKCKNLHGHTYHIKIYVKGPITYMGWVVDFGDIKEAWKTIEKRLDHHLLNDIEGLENPTAENLCRWMWAKLSIKLPNLSRIEIKETPTSGAIYEGVE